MARKRISHLIAGNPPFGITKDGWAQIVRRNSRATAERMLASLKRRDPTGIYRIAAREDITGLHFWIEKAPSEAKYPLTMEEGEAARNPPLLIAGNPGKKRMRTAVELIKTEAKKMAAASGTPAYREVDSISSGTIATITGYTKYSDIDTVMRKAAVELYEDVMGSIEPMEMRREARMDTRRNPFRTEHSCRLLPPVPQAATGASVRKSHGQPYRVLFQEQRGGKWAEQAYRYPAKRWTEAEARRHCRAHEGRKFERARPKGTERNPTVPSSLPKALQKYAHLPGFDAAVKRYVSFHGCMPTKVTMHDVPLGQKNEVVVMAALGYAPGEMYSPTRGMTKSNKKGSHWLHEYEGRKKPMKAVDGSGRLIITLPAKHRVTDWIRG